MILKNLRHRLRLIVNNYQVARRYDVLIEKAVSIKYWQSISFGERCTLQSGVYLYGSRSGKTVAIGRHVVIAGSCTVLGEGGLKLGDFTHLGPNVVLTTQYGDSATDPRTAAPTVKTLSVSIGSGCWIGSGSVIMPGTVLGDGSIVAPNSVVFGRWPAGARLSGNPARRMKR